MTIDPVILQENNLTLDEFLVMLISYKDIDLVSTRNSLVKKGYYLNTLDENKVVLCNSGRTLVNNILLDSDKRISSSKKEDRYTKLAELLRNLYPSGKKPGTNYLWKDSTPAIAKRLKTLVVKYNFEFTDEQAILATKKYINSFKGDYTYMQLLKYFILKNVKKGDCTEIQSEFMAYIEDIVSKGEVDNEEWVEPIEVTKEDWQISLI